MVKFSSIKFLFEPKSIAVIGASHNKEKIGYKILENIIKGGYKGKVYPINPKGGKILGLKTFKDISDVPGKVDVACIAIPAKYVYDAVKSCADKGVKFVPIITSGFSEVGNNEEEQRIVEYANKKGTRIIGPNIFGVYSSKSSLNATFGPDKILPGGVAIVTQSGALGLAMIGKTAIERIGLSSITSVGNKADVNEAEILDYLEKDKDTKIILVYIEGVVEGEKLVKSLKSAACKKPVIIIKSGRSKRGAIAVASHTGSLAGADDIFDNIMEQCGVLRAEDIGEAFDWCKFMVNAPTPKSNKTLIITNGGGIGVMAADACEKYGVEFYNDFHKLKETFSKTVPSFGSVKNPIDLTGQARSTDYNKALNAALKLKGIDSVIALYCETAVFDSNNLAKMVENNYKKFSNAGKPLVFSLFGGDSVEGTIQKLRKKAIPVFDNTYEAVSSLGSLYSHIHYKNSCPSKVDDEFIGSKEIDKICKKAKKQNRSFLLPVEAKKIMKIAGIQTPDSFIAKNIKEAIKFAKIIGYPVVMKVVSKDILHKSDVGGVILDLKNKEEVIDAYQVIMHNCKIRKPDAVIEGIEITKMVDYGLEFIVGARKDAKFGPIVMCGLGGVYVEVLKDVSFRALPIDRSEIMKMIKDIRSYQLLLGVRGEAKKDIEKLVDTILRVGAIVRKCKSISDVEINPVAVYEQGKGITAVDVRILLSKNT